MRRSALFLFATACALAASTFACSTDPTFSEAAGGAGGAPGSSSTNTSTSTSAGGGSTGTASGGGAASSSTGSGTGSEDCTNGVDDDQDGDVDCADSDCTGAGFSCAPAVPPGWSGPAALFEADGEPPPCSADWNGGGPPPIQGGLDVDAADPTCTACKCGAPTNVVCGPTAPLIVVPDVLSCAGAQDVAVGMCFVPPGAPIKNARVLAGPVKASGGSCASSGGAATVPPASFTVRAAVCASSASGAGCGAGVCAPKPPDGYGASLCIRRDGDVACPAVDYTEKTLVYRSIADTRGCSACKCSTPAGGTCTATAMSYTLSDTCSGGGSQTLPANGACTFTSKDVRSIVIQATGSPTGASCAPTGGAPTGAAAGAQPVTVCCEP